MLSKRQSHGVRVARGQGWEGGLQGAPLESFLGCGTALFAGGRGDGSLEACTLKLMELDTHVNFTVCYLKMKEETMQQEHEKLLR